MSFEFASIFAAISENDISPLLIAGTIFSFLAAAGTFAVFFALKNLKKDDGNAAFKAETKSALESLDKKISESTGTARSFLEISEKNFRENREELGNEIKSNRAELSKNSTEFQKSVLELVSQRFGNVDSSLKNSREEQSSSLDKIREAMEKSMTTLREENSKKLEEMRNVVEEKLQKTLETKIGASFKLVSERLESVYKSLGEMQNLASSVGDLKNVLTNVKTRGTWGETQLKTLLEDILTPEQFVQNYNPFPRRKNNFVEFAVKFPGTDDTPLYLPIDSKFPMEDYERLIKASENADPVAVENSRKTLCQRVETFASDISKKYLNPPATTDFGILFLPTENLYAEILRTPGFAEKIRTERKIVITGPTTLAALLNSLRLGFHTLKIQKNTSEVQKVLVAVKAQFATFKADLEKVEAKLTEAQKAISNTSKRHRIATGALEKVDDLELPGQFIEIENGENNLLGNDKN